MIYLAIFIFIFVLAIRQDLHFSQKMISARMGGIVIFLLISIAALRFNIGADTVRYMGHFEYDFPDLSTLKSYDYSADRYRAGFIFLCAICKSIWNDFTMFQVAHAIILNSAIFFFLRKESPYLLLSLLFYFLCNFLEFNTECLRESLAIAMCLLMFLCLKNDKFIAAGVLWIIAFYFHISSIIALLYPVIVKWKYTQKGTNLIFGIAIALPFIYQLIPSQLSLIISMTGQEDYYNSYDIREFNSHLNANYYIMHTIKYVILPYIMMRYINKHSEDGVLNVGFIYAFVGLQVLSLFTYAFYRLANYFAPFYWIFLAQFTWSLCRQYRRIAHPAIILSLFCLMTLYVYQSDLLRIDPETNKVMYERYFPYKSILDKT